MSARRRSVLRCLRWGFVLPSWWRVGGGVRGRFVRGRRRVGVDVEGGGVTGWRSQSTGGMPRHRGPYIRIRCFLCGHFCLRGANYGLHLGGVWFGLCALGGGGVWFDIGFFVPRLSGGCLVGNGVLLAPPSSVLRLNPSVLYTERRRQASVPFSGHYPVRSNHAALAVVSEEECNRLGSVFVLLCARG